MYSNFEEKNIPIKDLFLWDENARFPDEYFNKTEEELIDYFLSSEKKFKMKKLAKSIVEDFDLPQLEKIIVYDYNNNLIVLEGNRRLCIYKSIIFPDKVNKKELKKLFIELGNEIAIDENYELECLVTTNLEQGLRYIDRKHIQNNNEVSWGESERAHHNQRRGNAKRKEYFRIAISRIVRNLDMPLEMKNDILGKGYITTFFRILDSTPAWDEYGFELDEEGKLTIKEKDFEEKLKVIIYNVLQKKDFDGNPLHSRSLNKNEDKEKYLKKISKDDSSKVDREISVQTESTLFGDETIIDENKINEETKRVPSYPKSKSNPTGLFYSSEIPFTINNKPLKILYDELRKINVSEFPNATLDLLRSFLECALLVYFKKTGEIKEIKKGEKHNPTLGEMLTHIINGNCNTITDTNLIETIKHIKTDFNQSYSLERLHMINHNENWISVEKDARATWAKVEGLFKKILSE